MEKIDITFGSPDHGWLEVMLSTWKGHHQLDASDFGPDSLRMLVNALIAWYEGSPESVVEWFLEPTREIWTLRRRGSTAELIVNQSPQDAAHLEQVLEVTGTDPQICVPIWRALVALQSDTTWEREPEAWSWPFPAEALRELTEKIRGQRV